MTDVAQRTGASGGSVEPETKMRRTFQYQSRRRLQEKYRYTGVRNTSEEIVQFSLDVSFGTINVRIKEALSYHKASDSEGKEWEVKRKTSLLCSHRN